ncbi:MAG: isocitrate lyase/PEP mutase family protein [Rubrivivax sp.]|nr:isocitrate lyase/PEP mutase family protein [Rubrivivax sp.]
MKKTRVMRELLARKKLLVSPNVYDGYSALLVCRMGFDAAATTGAGLSNSQFGLPDIGLMSMMENVEICRRLARMISIPLMADADTGYGNAVSVYYTTQFFEDAGVVGINLEDQVSPKRCGHMQGKQLIDAREMAKKIEAAVRARKDDDFIINARTDAIAVEGFDKAVERLKMYVAAGADMVFPETVRDEDQIRRVVDAAGVPVSINMGFGIMSRATTPLIPYKRLEQIGVARVTVPRLVPAAAIAGMTRGLQALRDSLEADTITERPDLVATMDQITGLIGYETVAKLEEAFMLEEDMRQRYGEERPKYWSENVKR